MPRAAKRVLVFIGVAVMAFSAGFAAFVASVLHTSPQPSVPPADAVVVLTGGDLRVREGLKVFADGAGRRLLISGVNRATTRDDLRRLSGVRPVLFDCCVDVGYLALDTIGNAAETRDWLKTWGFQRLVIVTSNYHMPRSLLELRRALPDVELVPHPVVSRFYQGDEFWRHPSAIKQVAVEYVKSIPAALRLGWSRFFPRRNEPVLSHPPQREVQSRQRQLSGL